MRKKHFAYKLGLEDFSRRDLYRVMFSNIFPREGKGTKLLTLPRAPCARLSNPMPSGPSYPPLPQPQLSPSTSYPPAPAIAQPGVIEPADLVAFPIRTPSHSVTQFNVPLSVLRRSCCWCCCCCCCWSKNCSC